MGGPSRARFNIFRPGCEHRSPAELLDTRYRTQPRILRKRNLLEVVGPESNAESEREKQVLDVAGRNF
jgi:hypothetical protein